MNLKKYVNMKKYVNHHISGNSVLVCYYISRRKETAPMLYLLLTLTDLIVGTSAAGNHGNSYIIVSNSVVTQ